MSIESSGVGQLSDLERHVGGLTVCRMILRRLMSGLVCGAALVFVVAAEARAVVPVVPLPASPSSAVWLQIDGVDASGRFVAVSYPFQGLTLVLTPYRVDRLTGTVTPLPEAYAVSGDGGAVITTDGRWLDTRTHVSAPAPAPAGDQIAYSMSTDGRTYVWSRNGSAGLTGGVVDGPTGLSQPLPSNGYPFDVSGNGRFVLFGVNCSRGDKGQVYCERQRWDRLTGQISPVGETFGGIADDGRVIARAADGVHSDVIEADGHRRNLPYAISGLGFPTVMSANGRYVLYSAASSPGFDQFILDLDSGERKLVLSSATAGVGEVGYLALSGDGSAIVAPQRDSSTSPPGFSLVTFPGFNGPPVANLRADDVVNVTVAGTAGIGADATVATLNVTVVNPVAAGYLTVWPCGTPRPLTSNVNFAAGQTVANMVMTGIGADGTVCASSNVDLDVIVDAEGSFGPNAPYHSLLPTRLTDTRLSGTQLGTIDRNQRLVVQTASVVAPANASAVMLNVTATNSSAAGFVTVWPCNAQRPPTSNLNFSTGQTVAGAVLTTIDPAGRVCIASNVSVDIVADAQGWFENGPTYQALAPIRITDTRIGLGRPSPGRIPAGTSMRVNVADLAGIPADATAALLNVTAVAPSSAAYVTVWPCNSPRPNASNLNVAAGSDAANTVLTAMANDGTVCVYASSDLDIVIDAVGWLSATSQYHPLTGHRLIDTR